MLGVDLSVPLALAQVTNDILAAPGAAYSWYLGALDTDALAVDTATASALYALGVVTSSAISNKWEPDMTRHVAKWAALGVADGFCTHSWYGFIQGVANSVEMPRAAEALAMTVTSSTLYTPVYCTGFLVLLSLLEGKGVSGAVERTRLDFQELVWKTTKVWGPTNFLLFGLVPLHVRTAVSMGIHFVFLVGLALWDAAIRERRSMPSAVGPDTAEAGSASGVLQLKMATAFVPVESDLRGDAATDLPTPDA